MDAGGLAGSENFPLFRPDHSPRDTLGRTRAPRPGSPDVRSALALGCSSAATRRLPFALHLGLATAATDNCGTPLQHGTARDKVAEPKIAREAKLQTKSRERTSYKSNAVGARPNPGTGKRRRRGELSPRAEQRCWARAASSSSCAFPAPAAFKGTSYRRAGALRLQVPRRKPPDARTSHRHELPFNIMWARLKQVGWTWKQGSGLHPYSYFRPGANTSLRKGALEGRDYFSTEAAVVQFVKSRPVWKSKFYGAFDP